MQTPNAKPGPRRGGQRGQSLVEFAISLTLVLLLLAGVVDFGIAFFSFIALRDAAQEGALYGSMEPDDVTGMTERIISASNMVSDFQASGRLDINIAIDRPCEGGSVAVTLVYDYPITMPFLAPVIGTDTIPIRANVTDTILTPSCP